MERIPSNQWLVRKDKEMKRLREFQLSVFRIILALSISVLLAGVQFVIVFAQAPTATTGAATGVAGNAATLNGIVNANGYTTTVYFEYGLYPSYGATWVAAESPVTGSTDTAVSATISGLSSDTTYHYRVVAMNSNGTTYGYDMTFTTLDPSAITLHNLQTHISIGNWLLPAILLLGSVMMALIFALRRFNQTN